MNRCHKCKWAWYDSDTNGDKEVFIRGECRRYAPRVIHGVGTGYDNDKWAIISPDDWCGEFEELPKAEESE